MAVQKKAEGPEPSLKSTKQELLDAYNEMRQQLEEKDKTQLKPEQKVQEKKEAQVLAAVQATTADGVIQKINQLKQEMARTLSDLGDKLAAEVEKYNQVQAGHRHQGEGAGGGLRDRQGRRDVGRLDRGAAPGEGSNSSGRWPRRGSG